MRPSEKSTTPLLFEPVENNNGVVKGNFSTRVASLSMGGLAQSFWRLGIKVHLLWILVAVVLVAWFGPARLFSETWLQVVVGIAAGGGFDVAITWFRKRVAYLPQSGFITGLIVAIVLAPGSPLWQVGVAAAVGIFAKHLIRFRGRQIFNPAAAGLVAVFASAGAVYGWWGDAVPWLIAPLGVLIVTRTHKWPTVAAFGAAWLLIAAVRLPTVESIRSALQAVPLFFASVMLIEPMTTPAFARTQIIYGFVAGGIASALAGALPNAGLVVSLLAVNLATPLLHRFLRSAVPTA